MNVTGTLHSLHLLIRQQRPRLLILFFVEAITTSLLQGISLLLIVPLLYVSGLIPGKAATPTRDALPEWLSTSLADASVETVMLVYLAIVGSYAALKHAQQHNAYSLEESFAHRLRARAINLLCGANWRAFNSRPHADMLQFINEETDKAGQLANQFFNCITQAVTTAILLALSIWVSPVLTISLLAWGVATFVLLRPVNLAGKRAALDLQTSRRHILRDIGHLLSGFKSFKVNRQENQLARRLLATSSHIATARRRFFTLNSVTSTALEMAGATMIVLVIYCSFRIGHVQLDQLLAFVLLLSRLMPKANALTNTWQRVINLLATYQSLNEFLAQLETQQEAPSHNHHNRYTQFREIHLHDVSISHGERTTPVLHNVNLTINANTTTLISGESGSGKTTLLDAISGLLPPDKGNITIDGEPMDALSWRDNISYMTQQPFIQTGSIRDNLLWMQPDAEEPQLWAALQQAQLAETVRKLPQGLDTAVGENAGQLSGGERQRLALAMHLLKDAHVLIFDEVTSSLDADNRTAIIQAINALHGRYTIFVVTHDARGIAPLDLHIHVNAGETTTVTASHSKFRWAP